MVTLADATSLVRLYLAAEEAADLDVLLPRFAAVQTIRNAAQPVADGPDALAAFCDSFWDRTEERKFELLDVAVAGRDVLAYARAVLRFRTGATFGSVEAAQAFTIELPIALRFHIDAHGLVDELDVFHETTSAARAAAAT